MENFSFCEVTGLLLFLSVRVFFLQTNTTSAVFKFLGKVPSNISILR